MAGKPTQLCIALKGELDLSARQGLDSLLKVDDNVSLVVLDLRETTYLDSSALGAFIALRENVQGRVSGGVALAGAGSHVKRILEITGLNTLFECFGSVEEALASVGAGDATVEHRTFESEAGA